MELKEFQQGEHVFDPALVRRMNALFRKKLSSPVARQQRRFVWTTLALEWEQRKIKKSEEAASAVARLQAAKMHLFAEQGENGRLRSSLADAEEKLRAAAATGQGSDGVAVAAETLAVRVARDAVDASNKALNRLKGEVAELENKKKARAQEVAGYKDGIAGGSYQQKVARDAVLKKDKEDYLATLRQSGNGAAVAAAVDPMRSTAFTEFRLDRIAQRIRAKLHNAPDSSSGDESSLGIIQRLERLIRTKTRVQNEHADATEAFEAELITRYTNELKAARLAQATSEAELKSVQRDIPQALLHELRAARRVGVLGLLQKTSKDGAPWVDLTTKRTSRIEAKAGALRAEVDAKQRELSDAQATLLRYDTARQTAAELHRRRMRLAEQTFAPYEEATGSTRAAREAAKEAHDAHILELEKEFDSALAELQRVAASVDQEHRPSLLTPPAGGGPASAGTDQQMGEGGEGGVALDQPQRDLRAAHAKISTDLDDARAALKVDEKELARWNVLSGHARHLRKQAEQIQEKKFARLLADAENEASTAFRTRTQPCAPCRTPAPLLVADEGGGGGRAAACFRFEGGREQGTPQEGEEGLSLLAAGSRQLGYGAWLAHDREAPGVRADETGARTEATALPHRPEAVRTGVGRCGFRTVAAAAGVDCRRGGRPDGLALVAGQGVASQVCARARLGWVGAVWASGGQVH